jgi:hypothetical protein
MSAHIKTEDQGNLDNAEAHIFSMYKYFDSYTLHYQLCRDQPTKCTEMIHFFIYLYNGSYMFWQNNAILRERLFFLSEPLQRQYGRRQV